jgi:1-acyl-sn-glycerol-3-phosphate acyltransferase
MSFGEDLQNNNIRPWKQILIRKVCNIVCRILCLIAGVYTQNVRLEVDYSKYLGKNACQTLKYDGAGMHVINHITPFDILIHIFAIRPHTGYLGKREGYKLPGGRALATSLQFMVTGRDTKDDKSVREKLIQDIEDR